MKGELQILRDVRSGPEGVARTIRIYTPEACRRRPAPFPVVYMHDGQNLFDEPLSGDAMTWGVDEALEMLVDEGVLEPWIVVAVDHRGVERIADDSPWDEPRASVRGRGAAYGAFVAEQLKPWIDTRYPTRREPEWTATVGSSLGGLMALYLGLAYPDRFGRIGALSPSVMWSERGLFHHWRRHSRRYSRIYIDAGERERFEADGISLDYGAGARAFHAHLASLGYGEHELQLVLDPEGQHTEGDWRRRLPFALAWLLG